MIDPFSYFPVEISLQILSNIDDAKTLTTTCLVSKRWNSLTQDEKPWKSLCLREKPTVVQGVPAVTNGSYGSNLKSQFTSSFKKFCVDNNLMHLIHNNLNHDDQSSDHNVHSNQRPSACTRNMQQLQPEWKPRSRYGYNYNQQRRPLRNITGPIFKQNTKYEHLLSKNWINSNGKTKINFIFKDLVTCSLKPIISDNYVVVPLVNRNHKINRSYSSTRNSHSNSKFYNHNLYVFNNEGKLLYILNNHFKEFNNYKIYIHNNYLISNSFNSNNEFENLNHNSSDEIKIWNLDNGKIELILNHNNLNSYFNYNDLKFSFIKGINEKTLISCLTSNKKESLIGDEIKIWDISNGTGKCLKTLNSNDGLNGQGFKYIDAIGDLLITSDGSRNGIIKIWNIKTFKLLKVLKNKESMVDFIKITQDENDLNKYMLCYHLINGNIKVWNLKNSEDDDENIQMNNIIDEYSDSLIPGSKGARELQLTTEYLAFNGPFGDFHLWNFEDIKDKNYNHLSISLFPNYEIISFDIKKDLLIVKDERNSISFLKISSAFKNKSLRNMNIKRLNCLMRFDKIWNLKILDDKLIVLGQNTKHQLQLNVVSFQPDVDEMFGSL